MDQILQTLVSSSLPPPAANANDVISASGDSPAANSAVGNVEETGNENELEDVFKDLMGGFEKEAEEEAAAAAAAGGSAKATKAEALKKSSEKFERLKLRQLDLESRFSVLERRINCLRTRKLGIHIAGEIEFLRGHVETLNPPPPISSKIPNLNLIDIKPPPVGIVLPSEPVDVSANKSEIDSKIKQSNVSKREKADLPNLDKEKADEVLCHMEGSLHHLMEQFDSDATESSSGGESVDEFDNYSTNNSCYEPVRKRAKWTWLRNRASIASKWTWLTAQISDLEYRIRQQTDFYRQIRAAKGAVTLEPPVITNITPPREITTLKDSEGRVLKFKEFVAPSDGGSSSRTRPVKTVRRRRILSTKNLYKSSSRAAKESSVTCDCLHPLYWCSICYGRLNHTQTPEPLTQERGHTIALLDHSYHQVLSTKNDVSLDLHVLQKLKNKSWLHSSRNKNDETVLETAKSDTNTKKKYPKKKKKLSISESSTSAAITNLLKKKKNRRKSLTVRGIDDINDINSDDNLEESPLASPSISSDQHNKVWQDHVRRKRESAYDIDNIVIPYSIASATRVEKLQYKEILTPTWRVIEDFENPQTSEETSEDISLNSYDVRHLKAEFEEKKRWQTGPWNKQTGGQRGRSRNARTESGCNTPDPLSPAGFDTLEVTTRPSTPVSVVDDSPPASIRNRRRTSSATKSRDRHPSEDSRCPTPVPDEPEPAVLPFENRQFPISDKEYEAMRKDMPNEQQSIIPAPLPTSNKKGFESRSNSTENGNHSRRRRSTRASSDGEGNGSTTEDDEEMMEDDPDWNGEDPDDPEWDAAAAPIGPSGGGASSVSRKMVEGGNSSSASPSIRMPKNKH